MISRTVKAYALSRPTITVDGYGESVFSYASMGNVDASIYYDSQIPVKNPTYIEGTHTGITRFRDICIGDRLDNYEVIAVNPAGRLMQLVLKEVQ